MYRISKKEWNYSKQYDMSRSYVQRTKIKQLCSKHAVEEVNDRKDGLTWRCWKVHCITTEKGQYKVKDVKVSI